MEVGDFMNYEDLLIEAEQQGLKVQELPLPLSDGRIKGKRIAIRMDIPTIAQKADVLAEELGHYHTTVGKIIELDTIDSCKQERRARLWAYNKRIGMHGIVDAYKHHCSNRYEIANYLGVSEEFFQDALECYQQIYEYGVMVDNYYVQVNPHLEVFEYYLVE
ncbi:ImmA/IrrE family metallo-endopeptidase [[Clostridium] symbiosum]|uniref:ImmA/IrrE family metallo-endopeptidase n=1 Tax=Clostridium symbiosum TaxID=1512 RepID=UPI001FA9E4FB|nr:ImmA/IrrE family metallo-endopeptidase [[Clostridium] symbiosum]